MMGIIYESMEITDKNKKRLLKKWRGIKTRYEKYKKDWWKRVYIRWCTTVTVDLSRNIDFYEKEIWKAEKVIKTLA